MTHLDELTTQLNHQQTAITTIQATLAVQQNDIVAIKTAITDIRISINSIIHSLSDITAKLGFQITLPPPLPLFPTTPTMISISATAAPPLHPLKPSLKTKQDTHSPNCYHIVTSASSKTALSNNTDTSIITTPDNKVLSINNSLFLSVTHSHSPTCDQTVAINTLSCWSFNGLQLAISRPNFKIPNSHFTVTAADPDDEIQIVVQGKIVFIFDPGGTAFNVNGFLALWNA